MAESEVSMNKDKLAQSIKTVSGFTYAESVKVADLYRREKIASVCGRSGFVKFTHGAFLDQDVLERALKQAS